MSSRAEMMARLKAGARAGQDLPGAWQSRRDYEDPGAAFAEALKAVKGKVYRVESLEAGWVKLGEILAELGAEKAVVNNEPPLSEIDLGGRFPAVDWHPVGESGLRAACAAADVGITSAEAALAETGSLVLYSGPGKSRMVSLLPPVHVALVPESKIVMDIFKWQAAWDGELPANLVLVSGPSKTADIEQTLVVGVHGPKRLIVILYKDGGA